MAEDRVRALPEGETGFRLLVVEDEHADAELALDALRKSGLAFQADIVEARAQFIEQVNSDDYDLILADYRLRDWLGIDVIEILRELKREIPVIICSGTLGEESAVQCLKLGAADYVVKNRLARLPVAVRAAIDAQILRRQRASSEAALRTSEARYRSLVENATYGIYRATIEGEILDANPALVAMLGYESKSELLAVQKTQNLYQEPEIQERLAKQALQAGRAEGEVIWKRKDGRMITVRLNGRRVRDDSRGIDCFEIFVEDVTERRLLERQLQQKDKIEAIGQLAGGIAHDFNNMIGAILGWAELGLESTSPENSQHNHFRKIHQQGERAAALTRQLLAFARRQLFEPRNLDLNRAVREAIDLLEKMIGSDIEVKTFLAPDLEMIRCDPTQVEQVLMNLSLNARDAMPQGGRLVIETQNVEFGEEDCRRQADPTPGRYVQLTVADNGVGIDAATLDRIFEPFFTTKEVGKGTGLGLATVYGIVKQHGGFITVRSEPGGGASFHLYFPATRVVDELPGTTHLEQAVSGGTETILVAEDHEGLREMVHEALCSLGYQVMLARDGEAAVRTYSENRNRIDLVLLDMVMPKLNGPEVYQRLRALQADLRVVFATGYSAVAAKLDTIQHEGTLILQKPYNKNALARIVREALDQTQPQPVQVRLR